MPEETPEVISETPAASAPAALAGGAYEVIRSRLDKHGTELRERLGKLNADRQAVFGAIEPQLVATERVTTKNNCTPRDMVAIGGGRFLFGYNVQMGLKSTTELADVFAVYGYDHESHAFSELGFGSIEANGGGDFETDFKYVYKYYKETLFVKFMIIGPNLYMGFRIGRGVDDLKAFKFLINGDGTLTYLGNRFDHEYVFPPQQEFEWLRAHRDMHRGGEHPHISIDDRIFVETIGGDLTVKVEDNTQTGKGVYSEPVDDVDQTLDDAEIFYAVVGSLILLQIKPYRERDFRILVFNEKTGTVQRIDSIEHSCVLLPDDHGIIFSNGYHLQTGETKIFDSDLTNMFFDRRIASSNGEDFLFVFYNRLSGDYILLSYNLIEQKVETPIVCNGYSLFKNGRLIYFRSEQGPQKHHTLQVWQTPFTAEQQLAKAKTDSYLYKIGNSRHRARHGRVRGDPRIWWVKRRPLRRSVCRPGAQKTGDLARRLLLARPRLSAHKIKPSRWAHINATPPRQRSSEFEKVQRMQTHDPRRDRARRRGGPRKPIDADQPQRGSRLRQHPRASSTALGALRHAARPR